MAIPVTPLHHRTLLQCKPCVYSSAQSLPNCMILDKSTGGVTWEMTLPEGRNVVGGAIAPGRLYVATGDGWLHALGD